MILSLKTLKSFDFSAPTTINLLLPKITKENKEIKIRCSISKDGFPEPHHIKYHIGNDTYTRETVSL